MARATIPKTAPDYSSACGIERSILTSAVNIIEADNIILPKVATGLHLDDFQLNGAGVGQAMHLA